MGRKRRGNLSSVLKASDSKNQCLPKIRTQEGEEVDDLSLARIVRGLGMEGHSLVTPLFIG